MSIPSHLLWVRVHWLSPHQEIGDLLYSTMTYVSVSDLPLASCDHDGAIYKDVVFLPVMFKTQLNCNVQLNPPEDCKTRHGLCTPSASPPSVRLPLTHYPLSAPLSSQRFAEKRIYFHLRMLVLRRTAPSPNPYRLLHRESLRSVAFGLSCCVKSHMYLICG